MTKKENYKSFYKQIRVLRSINAATTTKIDEIIGGSSGRIKSQFDERTKLQQDMALQYGNYGTPDMKLMYLGTFAAKLNGMADFSTSAVEDGEEDDDE